MITMIACGLGLLVLLGLIAGLLIVVYSSRSDSVSSARQGWMDSRTDRDPEGPPF